MQSIAKVVFMGTPDFAVPSLRALAENPAYDIVAVVTQPDKPTGRKQVLTPPPVKVAAEALGLRVLQPAKVRAPEALTVLEALAPDVLITAAYGQILPQRLLDIPRRGCLNVHASLLPRWRGAAPIHRAIMAGDVETGVTIMEMVLALDAGPVVGVVPVAIHENDNVGVLHDKLAEAGSKILMEVLPGYLSGEVVPQEQPEAGVTYAERIARQDEFIDWHRSAEEVHNHIRGLAPRPGAVTAWNGATMKILSSSLRPSVGAAPSAPGTVVATRDGGVAVQCRDGYVRVLELQPSGKRRMPADAWIRGLPGAKTKFGSNEGML